MTKHVGEKAGSVRPLFTAEGRAYARSIYREIYDEVFGVPEEKLTDADRAHIERLNGLAREQLERIVQPGGLSQ